MKFILVTGMSGAGKTVALKTLEDCGFEAIDNLPLAFLPAVAASQARARHMVVACDIRSHDFTAQHFLDVVDALSKQPLLSLTTVFLDADDEVIRRRFKETRRRHPLAQDRAVMDGIALERSIIGAIGSHVNLTIDTSDLSANDLRQAIISHLAPDEQKLSVSLTSFSFKRGLPRDADLVFDVRFLKNPHYDAALQPHTGLDAQVGEYIQSDPDFSVFYDKLRSLIIPLLPRYLAEGKSYLTVAIGCTGGKHRSVYVTQKLASDIEESGYHVTIRHRDMETAS